MIAILGAGVHGRQIQAILTEAGHQSELFDDHKPGYRPISEARTLPFVAAAAWPHVRRQIASKAVGVPFAQGLVVWPGAQLGHPIDLGQHVHVEHNAVISHGCHLGDYVTVCPGAVLCGEVVVDDDVFVGANATIKHGGLVIGTGAIIGAGSVVLGDVAPGDVVAGVPARSIKQRRGTWRESLMRLLRATAF